MQDALLGPAGTSPSSECTSRACLLEELSISNRERPLSGLLLKLLGVLAEGAAPAGEVMPEPVAPGDVAATIDPRGINAYPCLCRKQLILAPEPNRPAVLSFKTKVSSS